MAERLTTWNGSKYILPQGRTDDGESNWRRIAERLAAYENIGSPEEIEEKLGNKIKVIVKHPYLKPMLCNIDNTLEEMQMIVGGYIETVTIGGKESDTFVVICNEEGRLFDLPVNIQFGRVDFVGTVILVGTDGEEFTDVPDDITKKLGLYELN